MNKGKQALTQTYIQGGKMSSKDGLIGGPDIDNEFQERKGGEEVEEI